jgi:hypothetical protein
MNVMFKNSRTLKDLSRHLHIADSIREYVLDYFAISETGKHNYLTSFLNCLSGGKDFAWVSCQPQGRSGGILVGV